MDENNKEYEIKVYKGEGRLVVEPLLKNEYGRWVTEPSAHEIITVIDDAELIGGTVIKWINYIKESPASKRSVHDIPTYFNYTKYKNWNGFFRNNLLVWISYTRESYIISSLARKSRRGGGSGYCGCVQEYCLPNYANALEIGQAVIAAFNASEEYHKSQKVK